MNKQVRYPFLLSCANDVEATCRSHREQMISREKYHQSKILPLKIKMNFVSLRSEFV